MCLKIKQMDVATTVIVPWEHFQRYSSERAISDGQSGDTSVLWDKVIRTLTRGCT